MSRVSVQPAVTPAPHEICVNTCTLACRTRTETTQVANSSLCGIGWTESFRGIAFNVERFKRACSAFVSRRFLNNWAQVLPTDHVSTLKAVYMLVERGRDVLHLWLVAASRRFDRQPRSRYHCEQEVVNSFENFVAFYRKRRERFRLLTVLSFIGTLTFVRINLAALWLKTEKFSSLIHFWLNAFFTTSGKKYAPVVPAYPWSASHKTEIKHPAFHESCSPPSERCSPQHQCHFAFRTGHSSGTSRVVRF